MFPPLDVARLCFYEESASVQLSDHAARTGSIRYSVPPGLKNIWYRDVFIFLVPTWYRSTGSSDNTIYIYIYMVMFIEHEIRLLD